MRGCIFWQVVAGEAKEVWCETRDHLADKQVGAGLLSEQQALRSFPCQLPPTTARHVAHLIQPPQTTQQPKHRRRLLLSVRSVWPRTTRLLQQSTTTRAHCRTDCAYSQTARAAGSGSSSSESAAALLRQHAHAARAAKVAPLWQCAAGCLCGCMQRSRFDVDVQQHGRGV